MRYGAALGAFLCALVPTMDALAQAPNLREAYVTVLKDLAKMRVEYENCIGDHTSKLRDLSTMVIDMAKTFKVMDASEAVDIVNDEQVLERVRSGRRCYMRGAALTAFKQSSDAFMALAKQ